MSAWQAHGTRGHQQWKDSSLCRTVQASTLTAGDVASQRRLHDGSRRRGTTALGVETTIDKYSKFDLYSPRLPQPWSVIPVAVSTHYRNLHEQRCQVPTAICPVLVDLPMSHCRSQACRNKGHDKR